MNTFPRLIVNYAACIYVPFALDPACSPLVILGEPFHIDPELRLERLLEMTQALCRKRSGLRCCLEFASGEFYYCGGAGQVKSGLPGPRTKKP